MSRKKLTTADITQLISDVHSHNLNYHTREIFLTGYSGDVFEDEPGIEYRAANTFIRNLHILEQLGWSKITVHMHIDGGSWAAGLAMFDAIQATKSQIHMIAYGQASSMSGVLLQAADKRILTPNTHFMLHHGSTGVADGTTSQAASEAIKFNDRECERMVHIFSERAVEGKFFRSRRWGIKRVAEYLDTEMKLRGDWYLTAEEAVDMGLADCVYGEECN